MSEPFTAVSLFKVATVVKTCVGWVRQVYRQVKKETPESIAIAATSKAFPSWQVKRALRRVLKTEEFENGLVRVRNGGEFTVDEHVANVLIDRGLFSSGLNSTGKDALKVVRAFAHHYREALLHSSDADAVSTRRADEHHRELVDEIRKSATANVSPDELFKKAREATTKLINRWLAAVNLGDSEPIALRSILRLYG